jgi:FAD/FMN-containing dehydrogenase
MKECYQNDYKVVVQSGNTSLVGGATPIKNEIILSMKRMNQIHSFNPNSKILNLQAGVILQNAVEYLEKHNHEMPYDLGARGSCLVGGNIATQAAGIHFV